jgi:hypothetical protein
MMIFRKISAVLKTFLSLHCTVLAEQIENFKNLRILKLKILQWEVPKVTSSLYTVKDCLNILKRTWWRVARYQINETCTIDGMTVFWSKNYKTLF